MSKRRMHADEVVVSHRLAAGLMAAQFPQWAHLAQTFLHTGGSENTLIRLGTDLVMRFPRRAVAGAQVAVEAAWLPTLAPHLPLSVPLVLAEGKPGMGYHYPWLVLHWIPGENAQTAPLPDDLAAARWLAGFVQALHALPVPHAMAWMAPDRHLRPRDGFTRRMIALIVDEADPALATHYWEQALLLPEWRGAPVMVHADLHPLNLLSSDGAVSAVIDWGGLCAGDPAHDLICAWMVLQSDGRALFRQLLQVDDQTWARARALAFSKALMAAPYYRVSNPPLYQMMRTALQRAMTDWPD